MSKHTPRPWVLVLTAKGRQIKSESQPGYFATIEGACAGAHGKEGDANARLIASAPDLLAALQEFVAMCDEKVTSKRAHEISLAARAAIAKAEES